MANLNQVNIIGHVTRDPELRYTPKGTATVLVGVAINRQWKNNDGSDGKEVTFIDVLLWQRLAEVAAEFLREGHPVFFTGRLHQEKWVDKNTQKNRTRIVIVAEGMQLLKQKPQTQTAVQHPARPHPPVARNSNSDDPQYPDRGTANPDTLTSVQEVFPHATPAEDEVPF